MQTETHTTTAPPRQRVTDDDIKDWLFDFLSLYPDGIELPQVMRAARLQLGILPYRIDYALRGDIRFLFDEADGRKFCRLSKDPFRPWWHHGGHERYITGPRR